MHQKGGSPTLDPRLCRIAPSYPIAKAFSGRSGKVYKPDLDTISSKTTHPLTTSHQQCTIQIYLFSFTVMLSMFFFSCCKKNKNILGTAAGWRSRVALYRAKSKPWILSATASHGCHQCAAVLLRGFQNHSFDHLMTHIGDSSQHGPTRLKDLYPPNCRLQWRLSPLGTVSS